MTTNATLHIDTTQVEALELNAIEHTANALPENSVLRNFLQTVIDASHRGTGITALVQDRDLTPNEAAKVLGMSRPHLLKFIRNGVLKSHYVGTHCRVSYADLMNFKDRHEKASKDVATALAHKPERGHQITLTEDEMSELDQL